MISIYVPVYNAAPWLDRLLRSLLALPAADFELVFVDDRSTDDSHQIIARAVSGRENVQLIQHEKNLGEGGASNTGIAAARGEYIMRCDADDEVAPQGLIAAHAQLEREKPEVLFAVCKMFSGDELIYTRVPKALDENLAALAWSSLLSTLHATLVHSSVARRVPFRPLPFGCDTLWLVESLMDVAAERARRTDEVIYLYHRREGSMSNPSKDQRAKYVQRVLTFEDEKEKLGAALVARGVLSQEAFAAGMIDQGRRIMRDLRKSGQFARAVQYYRDRSKRFGATDGMRKEFFRSLPLGFAGLVR